MMISDDGGQFAFSRRELAVLTGVMATDDDRGMAALWLHPSKAQAWATDGHRAVMVERELKPPKAPSTAKPVALPAATAHHAAKTAGPRDWIVIDISGKRVAIDVREPTGRGAEIESFEQLDELTESKHAVSCLRHEGGPGSIEGCFPTHHRRGSKGAVVAINPALLAPLIHLGKLTEPAGQVWINIGKVGDPALFVARTDAWTMWRMVVMPLRYRLDDYPDPRPAPETRGRRGRASKASPKPAAAPVAPAAPPEPEPAPGELRAAS